MLEFNKKITSCPSCLGKDFIFFDEYEHFGYKLQYDICNNCTLIFMQPQLSDEETKKFYKTEYRKLYQKHELPTAELIQTQKNRGNYLAQSFLKNARFQKTETFTYLDIGCSTGVHLEAIKQIFPNVNLIGIEPDKEFRQFCINKGLKVYESLELFELENIKVDAVSLSHVLEHISSPVQFLEKINLIHADNGLLMIEVPNTLGGHISFEIAHPICFYNNTLIETCSIANYENIFIQEHHNTNKYNLPVYLLGIFKKTNTVIPLQKRKTVQEVKLLREKALKKLDNKKLVQRIKRKLFS